VGLLEGAHHGDERLGVATQVGVDSPERGTPRGAALTVGVDDAAGHGFS
jgi:hypothetical protein